MSERDIGRIISRHRQLSTSRFDWPIVTEHLPTSNLGRGFGALRDMVCLSYGCVARVDIDVEDEWVAQKWTS